MNSTPGLLRKIRLILTRLDAATSVGDMNVQGYAATLKKKLVEIKKETNTRKSGFLTMITTFGIATNIHSTGLVQNQTRFEDLFDK